MSFFTSCFSCCFGGAGGDETEKAEATARHARIVSVYAAEEEQQQRGVVVDEQDLAGIASPPPCYADIAHDRPVVFTDSKQRTSSEENEHDASGRQTPTAATALTHGRRWSVSSRSSVVSVPSTRLSDLASMYTGTTRRGGNPNRDRDNQSETHVVGGGSSWRSSGWYGSDVDGDGPAPPSYYAGSTRSVSPIPTPASPSLIALPIPPPALAHLHHQQQHLHPVMQDGWFEGLWLDAERERDPRLHASSCARSR